MHSICLINEAWRISSCPMLSSKTLQRKYRLIIATASLSEDSDIDERAIWISRRPRRIYFKTSLIFSPILVLLSLATVMRINNACPYGQSATQFPQEHILETKTTRFHLIDTPGIGDCRGIEKDKENFENILAFLTCYDKINAVVVLLKPNNSRMTVAFRFCVLELLTHLHKSLVNNIIFAFTNSRGTFYRPGDSLPVLRRLLQERYINITLSPSTYFCFDNEAFRY